MNQFLFQKLIKDIPSIEVSLNWRNTEGQGKFESEFNSGSLTVFTSFDCFETGIFDAGDYQTQPSFSSDGLDILELEFNVYDKEGEEIKLSAKQEEQFSQGIKSSIISN